MGNESSTLVKIRRSSKDPAIIECMDTNGNHQAIYRKKSRKRSVTSSPPPPPIPILIQSQPSAEQFSVDSRKSSVSNFRSSSDGSGDSLLSPPNLASDRRRSRSLCAAQIKEDAQAVAASQQQEKSSSSNNRKQSSGLVPSLNRLRIQQCYKAAKPSIGDAIMKRAAAARVEMRAFLAKMNATQIEALGRQMYELITLAVENADKSDKVLAHAKQFGSSYAALCPLGFRPDLFTPLADAAIAECVKLDGVHKRCETLSAWSQLFSALFTGVRDGYYQKVRHQRRTSLPQNTITKQLSVDFSKTSDAFSR
ncbi:unnamed protein product [Caenorhabditis bovis]|uniref:Globin domain-containing protein n=1 Tax=Caenorhabditis bovis TaxID=2654633 RepID=A0A8S1EL05_9PELO|nr:unnamed protein product [Caenorhabditis bovis]